jgi:hypothetical protein
MNSYALAAMAAIQQYHKEHGKYPRFVEATAEHREKMDCTAFVLLEPNEQGTSLAVVESSTAVSDAVRVQQINIPIVALGTGDAVFRRLLVKNLDINLVQAKCATAEEFQRVGAKLARAGCLIVEPKESSGQQILPPFLFFSQIKVWIFGEEAAFNEVLADRLPEEQ